MTTLSAKDAFENELIPYALFHSNDRISIQTYQKDGEFHGPYSSRDKNNQVEVTGTYYEGKRVGIWTLLQEGGYILYNKDGKEHVRASNINDLELHTHVLKQTLPLSDAAISEAEAFLEKQNAQEDAYKAYRRGQPSPGF